MGISKRRVVDVAVAAVVALIGTASVLAADAGPSPAIPASTPPDPVEVTR
jgi:hypothetical protein